MKVITIKAEIEALEISLKLWIWLFKNPGKYKDDYPYYETIKIFYCKCPLCDLYWTIEAGCGKCVGSLTNPCFKGAYYEWVNSSSRKKSAAAYIASKIRRRLRKLTEQDFLGRYWA